MSTQVTDVYGNTSTYGSSSDARQQARDAQANVDRERVLLEAAQTGDYSTISGYQNMTGSERGEIEARANSILKKVNALEGANTGDYSNASSNAPMLYIGGGQTANSYNRVFSEGKGYAVYDSFTEEDGTQYLAVSGKNSSFIEKINPDGTRERVDSPSSISGYGYGKIISGPKAGQTGIGTIKGGTRRRNVSAVLGAFENLKSSMGTDDTTDTTTTDDDTTTTTTDDDVTTNVGTTGLVADDLMQTVSPAVAGGDFTSVTPPTTTQQVPAGGVPVVDPNQSQYVTQQVAPVTYQSTLGTAGSGPGTVSSTTQTGGTSAVPGQVTYKTQYAGTQGAVPQTLVTTQPGTGAAYPAVYQGYQTVPYGNDLGQTIMITEFNGVPTTYVPPGFKKLTGETQTTGAAEGGLMDTMSLEGKDRIFRKMGYNGPKTREGHAKFEESNPAAKAKGLAVGGYIRKFNKGGTVPKNATIGGQPHSLAYINPDEAKLLKAAGGAGVPSFGGIPAYTTFDDGTTIGETVTDPMTGQVLEWNGTTWVPKESSESEATLPISFDTNQLAEMQKRAVQQTMQPIQAPTAMIQPTAADFVPVDAGMTVPIAPFAEAATVGNVQQAVLPTAPATNLAGVTSVAPQVATEAAKLQAATGEPTQQITAQQQVGTSITGMEAALGNAIKVDAPDAREIQEGELISGAADATKAATFTEAVQAAEATPTKQATVAGQLEKLMADFEGGETPAWAAGSMRTAMATLAARGLGASSLAGQAVIQAAMEAALPIAQMDASTVAQFEMTNLSNRQQRQMLAAQQRATFMGMEFDQEFQSRVANSARIGDIANMNFTAEQQIALEDSRAANTMELSNLSNGQAMIMAEAAALSQLDMANLSNRQQAAVQNASNFLQMDMANLSNEQQTAVFKTQQNIQALFTDQAATNAAAQFNATSENQTDQFFANLANQTSQFNATQQNAMDQFNVNSVNALREFNSELQQQRDIFNAQNGLVIAQSNAAWRQSIATVNTATQNQSNMDFAKTINALTASNMDQIWQRERDIMSFAFAASENAADRANSIAVAQLTADAQAEVADNVGKGKLGAIVVDAVLKKWLS